MRNCWAKILNFIDKRFLNSSEYVTGSSEKNLNLINREDKKRCFIPKETIFLKLHFYNCVCMRIYWYKVTTLKSTCALNKTFAFTYTCQLLTLKLKDDF